MTTLFQAKRRYFDDKHFRRGFSRSGAFTIKEAELLESCGHTFKDLDENARGPANDAEREFVSVCRGEAEASTPEQKVWLKYKKLTGRKRFHGLVGSPASAPAADASEDDDEPVDSASDAGVEAESDND